MPYRTFVASIPLCVAALLSAASAEDKPAAARPIVSKPVVVVAAAGIDRLLQDAETIAREADRTDLYEQLKGLLENLGDFEGFDRKRPAGLMVFLGNGLAPKPEFIGFLPVADVDAFLKTLAFGPIRTNAIEGEAGRYEVVGPEGKFQMRIVDGWAFLAREPESLAQVLPNPAEACEPFLKSWDVAATVDMSAIPEGIKQVGLATARARVEQELKKQKGKSEAERRIQRGVSEELLALFDGVVKDVDRVVVGLEVSQESKRAKLEARLIPKAAGDALQPPLDSRFRAALDPTAPARASVRLRLSERQQSIVADFLTLVRQKGVAADATPDDPAATLLSVVEATASAGDVDVLLQILGAPPGPFVIAGAVQTAKGDLLATALPALVEKARKADNVAEAKTNVETKEGVALHRIVGTMRHASAERIYGEKPALLFGAGRDAFWFAFGGNDAADRLGELISPPKRPDVEAAAPTGCVEFVLHAGAWIGMQGDDGRSKDVELGRKAFARGKDELRISVGNGTAAPLVRLEADAGYLRLLGLAIGMKVDRQR